MCMIKRRRMAKVVLMVILFAPLVTLAATKGDTSVAVSKQEAVLIDLFKWVLGFMLAGQFFWIRKYMTDNEKKHDAHDTRFAAAEVKRSEADKAQWEAIGAITVTLNQLVGEHNANNQRRSTDPPEYNASYCRTNDGQRRADREREGDGT